MRRDGGGAKEEKSMNVTDLKSVGLHVPYDRIPSYVIDESKCRLADTILALIGGALAVPPEEMALLRGVVREEHEVRPIWPLIPETSMEMAGFLNGFFIRYADLGDTYGRKCKIGAGGHPSDMFAGILAMCDSRNVTGKRIIELLHLGYQMYSILQENMMYKRLEVDYTTTLALIIPVLAAVCFDASPERIQNALNLSASSAMIVEQVRPGDITNLKSGATAYSTARALWCYRFSEVLQAPASMFSGKYGWYNVIADLTGELAVPEGYFAFETVQTKMFPAYNPAQAPIECAISMHEQLIITGKKSVRIELRVCEKDAKKIFKSAEHAEYPTSMAEADHNLKYCVAVALQSGSMTSLQYSGEYLHSAEVRGLMDIIDVRQMDSDEEAALSGGNSGSCKLEVTTKDGDMLIESRSHPAGVLTGLETGERVKRIREIVDKKRSMLEKSGGYNFDSLFKTIFNLEQSNGQALIDEIRKSLK